MSKQAGTTKNVSTTGMPAEQQPYLNFLFKEAQGKAPTYAGVNGATETDLGSGYLGAGPMYFPGNTVAGFSPTELLAQRYLKDFGLNEADDQAKRAGYSVREITDPAKLDVASNPYVQNMISSSTTGVADQLKREAFPAIRSGAQLAGQFGGSRQGIAEGTALGLATQGAQQTAAGLNLGAYNTATDSLLKGLSMSPQIQQMGYTPADMLAASGGQERAQNQAEINADVAKWQYEQNLPYVKLNEYANLVRSPTGGTSTTETQYPQTSGAQQIAGSITTMLPIIIGIGRQLGWF